MTSFTSKLGTTKRGGTNSRLWIEGKRLIDAGFVPGQKLEKIWHDGHLTLLPCRDGGKPKIDVASVAGTATRPIIDINGQLVRDTFQCERVHVFIDRMAIVVSPVTETVSVAISGTMRDGVVSYAD